MKKVTAFAFLAMIASAPVAAQTQPQQPNSQSQPKVVASSSDPVICEKEDDLGSRLSAHKVCHTRSEWNELRRGDRAQTERVQAQHTMDAEGH